MKQFTTIDEYISAQSPDVAARLHQIRAIFHKVLPNAVEAIRYSMPSFTVGKYHLYMAAYAKHIGMYPAYGIPELDPEMEQYRGKGTKDALHFKHSDELPLELIEKIIRAKSQA